MKNFLFIAASILLDVIGGFDRCSSEHYDDVYLNVSTNTIMLDAKGTEASFDVSSNSHWRVSNPYGWFDVQPTEGKNNGQIRITATPNRSTGDFYSSSFYIISEGLSVEIKVVQKGKEE